MLEIYKEKYAPTEIDNINNEYDLSDEDLITYISKRQRVEKSNEFDIFIKGNRAPALSDTLNWWKVKIILNTRFLFSWLLFPRQFFPGRSPWILKCIYQLIIGGIITGTRSSTGRPV